MTDTLPALRDGLIIGEDTIMDPLLGRRLRLDESFLAVASTLPGSADEIAARTQLDAELVLRVTRSLEAQHLLDTGATRAHIKDVTALRDTLTQDPDAVSLIIRDDAAFTCTQCGSCCGGHNIGPVLPDTLDALSPHMSALTTAAKLNASPFYSLPNDGEPPSVLCRTEGGWCVFLDDTRRCTIHAALGGPAKPRVCQLFPWEFKATPEGISVTVSNECRGISEARHGQAVSARTPELRRLLRLIPPGHLDALPSRLTLRPGVEVSFAQWSTKLSAMHEALSTHAESPIRAYLAMREALDPTEVPPSDTSPLDDLSTLCEAMGQTLEEVAHRAESSSQSVVVVTDGIRLLTEALESMPGDLARVVAPLERPDQGELFATLMHHRLASHGLLDAKSASHGLAWLTFGWMLGRASAIRRARQVKRRHIVSQDLVDAMAPITFALRAGRVRNALQPFDDAILDLFGRRLDALHTQGSAHRTPNAPLELHAS